jgi:hypothetical protein
LDGKIKILREGSISIQVRTLRESPRPTKRVLKRNRFRVRSQR